MSETGRIVRVNPAAGIAGGEVVVECSDFDTDRVRTCGAWFGEERASLVGASRRRVLAVVPESGAAGELDLTLESDGRRTGPAKFTAGVKLAGDLHLVASPAFDPDDGSLFVTRSGSRGQQFPVTIFRIDTTGTLSDFSGDVANPTGIAFDREGQMFVTSRMDGTVYRVTP